MIISNVVKKEKMREIQSKTLEILKDVLLNSFGPMGSNTIIAKNNMLTKYSKDGKTILENVVFQNIIENSVKSDLEDITRHVVKNVGDGTTSAVILSHIIFEKLKDIEDTTTPYEIIKEFKQAVNNIIKEIENNAKEFNSDKAYEIAYISTNGNEEVSNNIKNIYDTYGNDVFIDVSISSTPESYLKVYDGMTLTTGYSDTAYINDAKKGSCRIRKPRVYHFTDPVDTVEMFSFLNTIIEKNIMIPYQYNKEVIPTVILAPRISRDMSSYITKVAEFMFKFEDETQKPPLLIVTNIHQEEQLLDISRLCGCKPIKKYIDFKQQEIDVENGLAPNLETVTEFYGSCDIVEADTLKTKFVNPKHMKDENGEFSETFKTLLSFLEAELEKCIEANENNSVTGRLKRRINSLKANMVEYFVGGVSMSDRDSVRDLVEDAVLNCRSASRNGVGYGANFEGLLASNKLAEKSNIYEIIYMSYVELVSLLYSTANIDNSLKIVDKSLELGKPYNIKTKEFDNKVICSIETDIVVLGAISQIISLMFTSNQFICESPIQNRYL
mgnify:CR=1 FL=1